MHPNSSASNPSSARDALRRAVRDINEAGWPAEYAGGGLIWGFCEPSGGQIKASDSFQLIKCIPTVPPATRAAPGMLFDARFAKSMKLDGRPSTLAAV